MTSGYKKILFVGLIFILIAFVGIVVVFYFMVDTQKAQVRQRDTLEEHLVYLNSERDIAKRRAAELEDQLGRSLNLKKVVDEANKIYDEKEKGRREGYLWIDRENEIYLVTLGALNGLTPGSRLAIYEGNERIGFVRVETPLDVISYVQPVNRTLSDFETDYYRVVFER